MQVSVFNITQDYLSYTENYALKLYPGRNNSIGVVKKGSGHIGEAFLELVNGFFRDKLGAPDNSISEAHEKNDSDLSLVAHEMRHQYDHEIGNMKDNEKDNTARDPAEIRAVNNENRAKMIEGMKPTTTYAGEKIDPKKLKNPPNNY